MVGGRVGFLVAGLWEVVRGIIEKVIFRPVFFCTSPVNVASRLCCYFGVFRFFRVLGGLAHHNGRWSTEALEFVADRASSRARDAPPVRRSAFLAWRKMWTRMLSVSCARAFATSLVTSHTDAGAGVDGSAPGLADLYSLPITCDANMCPEDFENSLWFQKELMHVGARKAASTCRSKGRKDKWIERTYDNVVANGSLKGKISHMEVVEDF